MDHNVGRTVKATHVVSLINSSKNQITSDKQHIYTSYTVTTHHIIATIEGWCCFKT